VESLVQDGESSYDDTGVIIADGKAFIIIIITAVDQMGLVVGSKTREGWAQETRRCRVMGQLMYVVNK
jgi:hypothetical protein